MIIYEWLVEQVNKDGDIVDTYHFSTPEEMIKELSNKLDDGLHYEYGIVRDKIDKFTSLEKREWAYIEDGVLPDEFDDGTGYGAKMPQKLKDQWIKASVR